MAATEYLLPFTVLEGSHSKDSVPGKQDEISENSDNLKQMTNGKPPRHLSLVRHFISSDAEVAASNLELDFRAPVMFQSDGRSGFCPVFRSGSVAEIGPRQYMEDEHICVDDLLEHLGATVDCPSPGAFYGVFDGHGGTDAASFIRKNILKFIVEESHFPLCTEVVKNAFVKADHALADDSSLDIYSGTTALTALIFGRRMFLANAGDCRAVLGKRGKAIELSKDHRPNCSSERLRIEKLGGVVCDGYLNGQLSVARALGDWHMKGPKGSACPLSGEPELQEILLTEEDEFLIMGSDGLWDVMSSQGAVTMARRELMLHNDPERCARELVREALRRDSCDNVTVIVVCFSAAPSPRIVIPQTRLKKSMLDPLDQSTKNIEHVARVDQCSPTVFLAEKKMVRKRRTMSVIFEENHLHFGRRCEGAAKSLGAMRIIRKHGINQVCALKRIHKQHGIHQWPFRQKWATRKGYSLGEERPFKVRRLSMDEKLDSRLQLIHMSQFARSSTWALALSDGGIVRPTALSSREFTATDNRADLVGQDQSSSAACHYRCKNTRETSDKQGLQDLQQHFGCKHKYALKSLGVSGSMFKSTCRQHWFYWWQGRLKNNEQQAFDATSNRAHLVKADERGPTLSNALFLEDLRHQFGARCKDAAKGLHDSLAWKSFKVQYNLPLGEQSNTRQRSLTHKHCVRLKKSQDLPRSMLRDCAGGLAAQSDIGLPDGGHILSLSEKKIVRKTLKRDCRTMSVLSLEDHQQHVGRRWEDTVKFLGAKRICRQLVIHRETTAKRICRQLGTRRWLFKQSAIGLPDEGHILYLPEKKILRKTLKRKCRSISVLSLEDHKQEADRRWEDAAKSRGSKFLQLAMRIRSQLVIHRLSTAKRTHKQHGIYQWPFQRSAIGLPDRGHILSLSEKKIVRKTLKRKCRSMSVLSLVDCQHVDRRWEDGAKNIGVKRICRQLVIHPVSIAKRICRQHGIHHRWPFERDWATEKGYSLGDKRPVEVISLSTHAELVSRLQLIYISWLGRFSPRPSALPRGGLSAGPIALSSSEFAATNNLAQRVGQDQRGSGAFGSENERTREQEDPTEIRTSITKDDLLQLHGRMTRKDAAAILQVSVSTVKRKCQEYKISPWKNGGRKRVLRPPDPHGKRNTSTACETPSHNVQPGMEGELVGQNQEANVFGLDFMRGPIAVNTESGSIMVSRPPDQHGERNTSTAHEMPSHNVQTGIEGVPIGQNQEANEFRRDFTEGSIPLNRENGLITGSSSGWASQVNDQSTLSTLYSNHNALVFPPPQMTSLPSENRGGSIDLRNSVASPAEPFSDRHISGSRNLAFRMCSYQAAPSQHVEGQAMQPTDHNAFVFPQTQMVSPQEPFPAGHVFELGNWNKHTNSVKIKAFYGEAIYKFLFPLTSGIDDLKKEVSKRLNVEVDRFEVKYMDEYGHLILIPCNEDWMLYLSSSWGCDEIRVLVHDKVGGTPNSCESCRSLMQRRA